MNFWDLQCFLVTAEELSFTKAAHRLHISQQSLSARIAKLEEHYQIKLFERTSPLTLTTAGLFLLEQAKMILEIKDHVDTGIQNLQTSGNESLRIGTLANRGTVMLQATFPQFQELYPNVRLQLEEIVDCDIFTALGNKPIDLLFGFDMQSKAVTFIPLYKERYYICISNALMSRYFDEATQEEILASPATPISAFCHCPFLASSYTSFLTDVFKRCCQEADMIPNIVADTSSILTRLSFCISGMGIMFISDSLRRQVEILLDREQAKRIFFIPIDYRPEETYCLLGINYLNQKKLSEPAKKFIQLAQDLFPTDDCSV